MDKKKDKIVGLVRIFESGKAELLQGKGLEEFLELQKLAFALLQSQLPDDLQAKSDIKWMPIHKPNIKPKK